MKRVLLTGASGFIGSQAVELLGQRGFEVHAVSSRQVTGVEPMPGAESMPGAASMAAPISDAATVSPNPATWHRADLLDADGARALVERVRPTHLLHFAWYAEHGEFWNSTENLRWVEASLRLLRAFGEHGGRRAVIAGTCAEYDWSSGGRCVEGSTTLVPRTLYGVSKDALRRVAQVWTAEQGISFAWGRVFFVFGEREHPGRLVPAVARAVLAGNPAPCSHGRQLRDFLDTSDAAGAFVALLDSDVEGAVNIGSGQPVSVGELVGLVAAVAGGPELVRLGELPERPGEPAELTADVTRLGEEVGWAPALTLEQGVERAVRWQRCSLESSAQRGGAA